MKSYALEELTTAKLSEVAVIRHETRQPAVWDELARREIGQRDRAALDFILDKLRDYGTLRVNEATIWARAIYPLLALAERDDIRAWALVPLAGKFNDVEIGGEVDGALASSFAEEVELPYFIVVEAKRGVGAFVRGTLDWSQPKPSMSVLPSREYTERSEATAILAILQSILAQAQP